MEQKHAGAWEDQTRNAWDSEVLPEAAFHSCLFSEPDIYKYVHQVRGPVGKLREFLDLYSRNHPG